MADAPLAAVGITDQPRGREEEPAPAPHPQRGIVAVHVAKNTFDLVATRIEVGEPFKRGALIRPRENVQMVSTQPELPVRCCTSQAPTVRTDSESAVAASASKYRTVMQSPAKSPSFKDL